MTKRAFRLLLSFLLSVWPSLGSADTTIQQVRTASDTLTVTWELEDTRDMTELRETLATTWRELERDFESPLGETLTVRVLGTPAKMRAAAPPDSPPPRYATGVAYPTLGIILLTRTAPESWKPASVHEVLKHELAHVALARATRRHDLPTWFVEGLAIRQSGERSLDRFKLLWTAAVTDALVPLSELEHGFREHEQVSLGYAESADAVHQLLKNDPRGQRLRELTRRLREGEDFNSAMLSSFHYSSREFGRTWKNDLQNRMSVVPLIAGGTTFWLIASVLLVIAWQRKRLLKQNEPAELEAMEEITPLPMATRVAPESLPPPVPHFLRQRDTDIPTVQHEGKTYTLH